MTGRTTEWELGGPSIAAGRCLIGILFFFLAAIHLPLRKPPRFHCRAVSDSVRLWWSMIQHLSHFIV